MGDTLLTTKERRKGEKRRVEDIQVVQNHRDGSILPRIFRNLKISP